MMKVPVLILASSSHGTQPEKFEGGKGGGRIWVLRGILQRVLILSKHGEREGETEIEIESYRDEIDRDKEKR